MVWRGIYFRIVLNPEKIAPLWFSVLNIRVANFREPMDIGVYCLKLEFLNQGSFTTIPIFLCVALLPCSLGARAVGNGIRLKPAVCPGVILSHTQVDKPRVRVIPPTCTNEAGIRGPGDGGIPSPFPISNLVVHLRESSRIFGSPCIPTGWFP